MLFRSSIMRIAFLIFVLPLASTGCSSCGEDSRGDPAASSAEPVVNGEPSARSNRLQQPGHLPIARHEGFGYQVGHDGPDGGGTP